LDGSPDSICLYLHKGLRVTADVGDAAQLCKFITALSATGQMILFGRSQRISNAECVIG
jgi:hypothetical protein